jgi:hypothetical protein
MHTIMTYILQDIVSDDDFKQDNRQSHSMSQQLFEFIYTLFMFTCIHINQSQMCLLLGDHEIRGVKINEKNKNKVTAVPLFSEYLKSGA